MFEDGKKAKKTHHRKYSEWKIDLYFVLIISKHYFNENWFWHFSLNLKIGKLIFELDISVCNIIQCTQYHITETVLKLKDTIENHWGEYDELGEEEDEDGEARKMKALAEVEVDWAHYLSSSSFIVWNTVSKIHMFISTNYLSVQN